jgi:hypothetical protein
MVRTTLNVTRLIVLDSPIESGAEDGQEIKRKAQGEKKDEVHDEDEGKLLFYMSSHR